MLEGVGQPVGLHVVRLGRTVGRLDVHGLCRVVQVGGLHAVREDGDREAEQDAGDGRVHP